MAAASTARARSSDTASAAWTAATSSSRIRRSARAVDTRSISVVLWLRSSVDGSPARSLEDVVTGGTVRGIRLEVDEVVVSELPDAANDEERVAGLPRWCCPIVDDGARHLVQGLVQRVLRAAPVELGGREVGAPQPPAGAVVV